MYAGIKAHTFHIGENVWLLVKYFLITRPFKYLNYKWARPYTVTTAIHKNAYQLYLLKTIANKNILPVLHLEWYTASVSDQPSK